MGLAEPRKRLKISHDPNNLAWSQSADSYGLRLLQQQGWRSGEGLGARDAKHLKRKDDSLGKVNVQYKDDVLGLGAKLKSQDVQTNRAGLDAFAGLLGRLNGKSEIVVAAETKKVEDRKLAMWAQGRWGGMTFVSGGVLVQGDAFKTEDAESEIEQSERKEATTEVDAADSATRQSKKDRKKRRAEREARNESADHAAEKARRKDERRRMKAERRQMDDQGTGQQSSDCFTPASESQSQTDDIDGHALKGARKMDKIRKEEGRPSSTINASPGPASTIELLQIPTPPPEIGEELIKVLPIPPVVRNGRHLLRGKNIQAKRAAFGDAKMLDEIFMRKS